MTALISKNETSVYISPDFTQGAPTTVVTTYHIKSIDGIIWFIGTYVDYYDYLNPKP